MGMLEVSAEFAENVTFNQERIRNALPAGYLDATTLADYLVKKVLLCPFMKLLHSAVTSLVFKSYFQTLNIAFANGMREFLFVT